LSYPTPVGGEGASQPARVRQLGAGGPGAVAPGRLAEGTGASLIDGAVGALVFLGGVIMLAVGRRLPARREADATGPAWIRIRPAAGRLVERLRKAGQASPQLRRSPCAASATALP